MKQNSKPATETWSRSVEQVAGSRLRSHLLSCYAIGESGSNWFDFSSSPKPLVKCSWSINMQSSDTYRPRVTLAWFSELWLFGDYTLILLLCLEIQQKLLTIFIFHLKCVLFLHSTKTGTRIWSLMHLPELYKMTCYVTLVLLFKFQMHVMLFYYFRYVLIFSLYVLLFYYLWYMSC